MGKARRSRVTDTLAATQAPPQPPPAELRLRLFAPGMTPLHRAGLGGLACTLRAMERARDAGVLGDDQLPGDWAAGPPWSVSEDEVVLRFGSPASAGEYLRRLFGFAFQIRDGVIYLPGQYPDPAPSLAVRAELQTGLTLTFLQHGKTRGLGPPTPFSIDPDGGGVGLVAIDYRVCTGYKHQSGWEELVDGRTGDPERRLTVRAVEVIGPLNPGATVRHVAFAAATRIEAAPDRVLALYFALVGCLSLVVNRGCGVLIVPDEHDLKQFADDRPYLTPRSPGECRVAGTGDAVLQAMVRLRSRGVIAEGVLPACYGFRFAPTTWATQQKSRVDAIATVSEPDRIEPTEPTPADRMLTRFEVALHELPPRVRVRTVPKAIGSGRNRRRVEQEECWVAESVIRPLIADNLATGRRWYDRFDRLHTDPESRGRVKYETRGLRAMATNRSLTDNDEAAFIAAVHRAVFMARGRIYADTMGAEAARRRVPADAATQKRWERFMERLRLDLVGAKTASQAQEVINKLLARNGTVKELRDREAVQLIRRIVFGEDWHRARNLALFALASYQRPPDTTSIPGDPESEVATHDPETTLP